MLVVLYRRVCVLSRFVSTPRHMVSTLDISKRLLKNCPDGSIRRAVSRDAPDLRDRRWQPLCTLGSTWYLPGVWTLALWSGAVLLALFARAGFIERITPRADLSTMMPWAADVPVLLGRFIGLSERVGVISVLPLLAESSLC